MGIWTPSGGLEVSLIIHGKMGIRYTRAKSGNFENGTLVFHSKMGIYPQNSCSGVAKWDPILSRGYCTQCFLKVLSKRFKKLQTLKNVSNDKNFEILAKNAAKFCPKG